MLSISKESPAELSSKGYTLSDISKIQNVTTEYAKHLEKYAKLDAESLKRLGYSSEQIELFRNFVGTESQIRALAATLSLTMYADYVTWSATENRTNARIRYDFNWSGVPMTKTNDIVAVSWNDWQIGARVSYVTYTHVYGSENDLLLAATPVANNGPTPTEVDTDSQ